ncbi:class I SAM-dependent methyltransferase [Alteromonas sp. CYL-A6]|uniref:class I SAM-dependent methyltransferase n=1 Tax=Alteromonas nitratireducens TaxID=3390813 RepID=UPI0034AF36AA
MPESIFLFDAENTTQSAALAASIAEKWGLTSCDAPPDTLYLRIDNNRLGLMDGADPAQKLPVVVDFLSAATQYRQSHGGGKAEPVVKAIGLKGHTDYHVVDATPGLGRDAFVLVSAGCRVTMIERSPVVAALLEDGLRRLTEAQPETAKRMALIHGNSQQVMQYWNAAPVDAVYLDPMFPHRKKSALVKKEMRLFQQLLGGDPDADGLLAPACELARHRVVVKRPDSAGALANTAPSMAITSKKHRFDVYICHHN